MNPGCTGDCWCSSWAEKRETAEGCAVKGKRRRSGGGDKMLRELCRFREGSEMPERVQLRRTKGWRMPRNTVKVDRTTMWGNHIAAACCIKDRVAAVELFRRWVDEGASWAWKGRAATDLRGKNLACW